MTIKLPYVLTAEQRHAGYSAEYDGGKLHVYYNGKVIDSFEAEPSTILQIRQVVQNHMEMQKSGIEFAKGEGEIEQ